ncbi:hypothetical protein [Streptomyces sp. NPDC053048]|uniref:hypothetical protein n=1 Tax=Streptomyces sp. NPDC053048 TaxID=3365694 RepID=UPI0037D0F12F
MHPKRRESRPAAEALGPRYPVAKEAKECLDAGMSVKEAMEHARTTVPDGKNMAPQQVVQGMHDILALGPDEAPDDDRSEDDRSKGDRSKGDRRHGPQA